MRVLHVINSLAQGGAERLLADMAPRLAARGVACSVFALDATADAFSTSLGAAGIEVNFARDSGASIYSPARLLDVAKAVRRGQPDIVHAHLGPSFHWVALASLVAKGTALVATEHASENRRMSMPLVRGFERWCYGRYERIACVSESSASRLEAWLGRGRVRTTVIPNGIDLSRFQGALPAKDVAAWLRGRKGIVIVARLVEAKDHATALSALARLPSEFAFVLAGEGPLRGALQAQATALGIAGRVRILGSRNDIPSVLAAATVCLQSSRVEGFGIAAIEAMASGLPVVASDAPGLGEVVRGAGLLFPPGDAEACAKALSRAFLEPGLADSLRAQGRDRAKSHSIERTVELYSELYDEIAASKKASA